MLWIGFVLLLSFIGISFVIVIGNPVLLPITILGTPTLPLPLWSLLLGAALLGGLTGTLLLRLLERDLYPKASTQRPAKSRTTTQRPKQKVKSSHTSKTSRVSGTDWDEPRAEDWFGSSAKVSGTEYASRSPRDEYSTPRSPRSSGSDRVVDADYRVITPPYVAPPPRRPRDDWDDEFFEDEP